MSPSQTSLHLLIVDDEHAGRARTRTLLESECVGATIFEAESLGDARAVLAGGPVDVVFLDIHMPPENGFDLLTDVPPQTAIVFVTAHDAYAIRAFEVNAVDYLLKPVDPARLRTTLFRLQDNRPEPKVADPTRRSEQVIFRDGRSWHQLSASEIALIRADGAYSILVTAAGEEYMVIRSLRDWIEALPQASFLRLSRSLIVNTTRIDRVDISGRDKGELWLRGLTRPVPLRRTAINNLRKSLP
ncbi:MAG: LytTR family DNA-binding domain-containing protein [Verrucomicrobiota bacterium]